MAELLVLTQATANRTMFAGDVVTVQPDGWQWGAAERGPDALGMWTVIDVPGVPESEFLPLLESVQRDGAVVLFRRVGLNLLALGPNPTFADIQAARVEKTTIPLLT